MNKCPFCGAEAGPDSRFCQDCGRELAKERVSSQKAVLDDDFNVAVLDRLREEKNRLSRQLNSMLDVASDRELSRQEKKHWKMLRKEHHKISEDLAGRLQYLSQRQRADRRKDERRTDDRRTEQVASDSGERRSGMERRQGDRRASRDRRNPFPTEP
jgi:hypothetical protein